MPRTLELDDGAAVPALGLGLSRVPAADAERNVEAGLAAVDRP